MQQVDWILLGMLLISGTGAAVTYWRTLADHPDLTFHITPSLSSTMS